MWRNRIKLYDLLSSENTIMIESRKVRWSENVARREALKNLCTTLVGKPEQKNLLADAGIDWSIILKFIL